MVGVWELLYFADSIPNENELLVCTLGEREFTLDSVTDLLVE